MDIEVVSGELHAHYTTGPKTGREGDFWAVFDGCRGLDYIRTVETDCTDAQGRPSWDAAKTWYYTMTGGRDGKVSALPSWEAQVEAWEKAVLTKLPRSKFPKPLRVEGNKIVFDVDYVVPRRT